LTRPIRATFAIAVRFDENPQQRFNAIGFAKVYFVCTSNLASHRVIVCAERNRVFSTFTIIVIGVIVVVVVVVTTHYVNDFKRVAVWTFP